MQCGAGHDQDEAIPLERLLAHGIVRMAGFPLWRKLVDRAIELRRSGLNAVDAAVQIARTTKRLPR